MNTAKTSATAQGVAWFKSSYSGAEGGQCVEVANVSAAVHIRDSKVPTGPVLTVTSQTWTEFVRLAADQTI
ncbi:DUF397 domain-containing protein [Streptomyces sp. ISL-99]|uniref:DUF397 domain-containing protein n=1 Tax=Streptomyces sp. ISL-99 TaxID=2819193 RepID=UPI001BE8B5BC|nr:DUF397 domain-containing protein [Streptomyces sp. ISL-99]MBT2525998.1 DUF397 domain-containing protein [Streptomyces sp. ISL-99]